MPEVFEALCTAAPPKLQGLREIAVSLWAMANAGSQMPDVFEALCTAAPQQLQDLQEIAASLWAMAEPGSRMPDVFEAFCTAAPQKLQDSQEIAGLARDWRRPESPSRRSVPASRATVTRSKRGLETA